MWYNVWLDERVLLQNPIFSSKVDISVILFRFLCLFHLNLILTFVCGIHQSFSALSFAVNPLLPQQRADLQQLFALQNKMLKHQETKGTHTVLSLYVHCMVTVRSLYCHCTYTVWSLCVHCIVTVRTLYGHCTQLHSHSCHASSHVDTGHPCCTYCEP